MKKIICLAVLMTGTLSAHSCADPNQNRHQYELGFKTSGQLTVLCDNCFYYYKNYDTSSRTTIVDRKIDANAIELFSSIEFCGVGDTTPDGLIRIVTDTGSVAEIGVLFPNQELNPTLMMQSSQTGLGSGCTRQDQENFEKFFQTYAGKTNL